MAFTVVLKPAAVRDLRKLPEDLRRRIATRIDALATDPTPAGVEPLKGERDLFRLRMGDYRILYRLDRKARVVLVARIGHRREVYRRR
ncbi:MAG: type II toxin-antitoxin system RelE/ParE family toxin [Candidatus Methylomirabilota bacterium]